MTIISIPRGNTRQVTVTVTDSTGAAFDLTAYTMTMSVNRHTGGCDGKTTTLLSVDGVIDTPATGIGVITLYPTQTATLVPDTYMYDVTISSGTTDKYTVQGPDKFIITDVVNA